LAELHSPPLEQHRFPPSLGVSGVWFNTVVQQTSWCGEYRAKASARSRAIITSHDRL
jgi:hypothetical protein